MKSLRCSQVRSARTRLKATTDGRNTAYERRTRGATEHRAYDFVRPSRLDVRVPA